MNTTHTEALINGLLAELPQRGAVAAVAYSYLAAYRRRVLAELALLDRVTQKAEAEELVEHYQRGLFSRLSNLRAAHVAAKGGAN